MDFASTPGALLLNAHRDPRPIFVLDIGDPCIEVQDRLDIAFCNEAFRERALESAVNECNTDGTSFRQWVIGGRTAKDVCEFAGHTWTRENISVNSQNVCVFTGMPCSSRQKSDAINHHAANMKALRISVGELVTPALSEHLDLIDSKDWSAGLGLWPPEILEFMRMMLILDAPIAMSLGEAGLLIYNIAYALKIAGSRHPRILGVSLEEAWPEGKEVRAEVAPTIAAKGFHNNETPMAISDSMEKFCTWTIMRISPKSQLILSADCTTSVLEERRRSAFAVLRDQCANLDSFSTFCDKAGSVCLADPQDISFVLCYKFDTGSKEVSLQTAFPTAPVGISTSTITTSLENISQSTLPVFLTVDNGTLPAEWQDIACVHGHGEKATTAIATCLRFDSRPDESHGIIVVGLNPKRPLDSLHRAFAESIIRDLSAYALSSLRRAAEVRSIASRDQRLDNFAKLFEMTDVGLFEYDSDWKLTHANDAYFSLSGYPRDLSNQTSMTFVNLLHPEDVNKAMSAWEKLAVESLPISFEFRWKWPDRELTDDEKELGGQWVFASCLPIFEDVKNETASITGAMGVMISSTETKRATLHLQKRAEALELARDTEERFKAFAENAPAGIYIFDRERKLQYCNNTFFDMIGASRTSKFEEYDHRDHVLEEDVQSVTIAFQMLLEDHKAVSHRFRVKRKWTSPDGIASPAFLTADSYPVLDDAGNVTSVQGVMFDVSNFMWAENIQKARLDEAVEAKKQQERFIDMTSHELRNPLSAVVQCTEVVLDNMKQVLLHARQILRGTSLEAQEQYQKVEEEIGTAVASLRTVEECTSHMRRIIDDVLSLSKLDAKLLTINPTTVRFEDAIRDCTKVFHSAARADGVELELEPHESLKYLGAGYVDMDAGRVGQIIANCLTNAIKFTRTEAVRKICVRCGASTNRPTSVAKVEFPTQIEEQTQRDRDSVFLWCSITDTGSGLSEAQQSLLFHRFSQAFAPKTHSQYGGSGLGLFISKSLCELQGGEINVYSAGAGKGSTFAFYIESIVVVPPPQHLSPAIPNRDATSLRQVDINPAEVSIMVVEDNIVNSKVLVQQLKKQGFVVHVAYHGGEALDILRKSQQWKGNPSGLDVNIITMDVEMPVMGGLACTRAIRKHEADGDILCHIPIIAVSANARQEQMDETRAAGMDESIAKPFRIKELLPKIQRLALQTRSNGTT